jgi:hypothetical protein
MRILGDLTPRLFKDKGLGEIELTTQGLAEQLTMLQVSQMYSLKCHLSKPPEKEPKEYCECKEPMPRDSFTSTLIEKCRICEKPIKEEKKECWNSDNDEYTHLTIFPKGSHHGKGSAKDCKICNPEPQIEELVVSFTDKSAMSFQEQAMMKKINELVRDRNKTI